MRRADARPVGTHQTASRSASNDFDFATRS